MPSMFAVYILNSAATGRWCYGAAARLAQRLAEHYGRQGVGEVRPCPDNC